MNQITLSLKDNPDLATLLANKKAGERVKLTDLVILIAEKDDERFVGTVEEVSGDDMFDEEEKPDESKPSVKVAKATATEKPV